MNIEWLGALARRRWTVVSAGLATISMIATSWPSQAEACGCLSPPDPVTLGSDEFAVNQQSEQIIFEVGEDTVTAHVLIRYAGEPEQFAWIVPVPNAPELALSEQVAFALVDNGSSAIVFTDPVGLCPVPEYECRQHSIPSCGNEDDGALTAAGDSGGGDDGGDAADADADAGGEPPPGIDVIDMQMVGSYETVTFAADEAGLAVQWLSDNGFIVNDTMTPYMQPYIDAGMLFVAAKLEAGAGIDAIEPLQMTYQGTTPMIPLQLTAVAAEPHLTVTAYIYGDDAYRPSGHPEAVLNSDEVAFALGRMNYPMLMARTIDEAGGDAWVREFTGIPFGYSVDDQSGCCGNGFDSCGLGGDSACQCPTDEFDAADCSQIEGLLPAIEMLDRLASEHSVLTRLTTRISPEEMDHDPAFEIQQNPEFGRLTLAGPEYTLQGCTSAVVDPEEFDRVTELGTCATTYCGQGECVIADSGPGCVCNDGFVGRAFTDLDGERSVTCVPETPPVDLGANTTLPDTCARVDCGSGTCVDLGGFAACDCGDEAALATGGCEPVLIASGTTGAANFTTLLQDIQVCSPPPPDCGPWGWLEVADYGGIHGVACASSLPAASDFVVPPMPTCDDIDPSGGDGTEGSAGAVGMPSGGCGCVATANGGTGALAFGLLALLGWRRRRRD